MIPKAAILKLTQWKTQSAIGQCHSWDWSKIYDEFGPVIVPCYNDRRHMILIKVEIGDPISTSDITVLIFASVLIFLINCKKCVQQKLLNT